MRKNIDIYDYAHELERHLRLTLFGRRAVDPEGAVLLVRGALADGDQRSAAELAEATRRLAAATPQSAEMTAAADHARGLIDQDPAVLESVAATYRQMTAQAGACEDAGCAWAERGDHDKATAWLSRAHALYKQAGSTGATARVRASLREADVRLRHWTQSERPARGWASLTDTERHIAGLVAQGLSNRQVASQVYLSTHTVAFHLRHIFWKLGITSRVHLTRLVAVQEALAAEGAASAQPGRGALARS
jgi:DNA-binding CsgD family transcriptional regulator